MGKFWLRQESLPKQHQSNRQVHRVASSNKTHECEVDPTGIEGLSNFSLVVELVKRIKIWLIELQNLNCIEIKEDKN